MASIIFRHHQRLILAAADHRCVHCELDTSGFALIFFVHYIHKNVSRRHTFGDGSKSKRKQSLKKMAQGWPVPHAKSSKCRSLSPTPHRNCKIEPYRECGGGTEGTGEQPARVASCVLNGGGGSAAALLRAVIVAVVCRAAPPAISFSRFIYLSVPPPSPHLPRRGDVWNS